MTDHAPDDAPVWPEGRMDTIGQNGNDGDHYPDQEGEGT